MRDLTWDVDVKRLDVNIWDTIFADLWFDDILFQICPSLKCSFGSTVENSSEIKQAVHISHQ